jgi:DNA-binding MarR family transcriptional regulator
MEILENQREALSFLMTEEKVRKLLRARRLREKLLGPELFADPAWDILLEAFAATLGQRRVSITSLCQGSAVPTATGVRWIGKLQEDGWLVRRPDPLDGRRHWIELTANAQAKLQSFFQAALPSVLSLCAAKS